MTETAAVFERERYIVLPSLLKNPKREQFYRYACMSSRSDVRRRGDEQVPGTPSAYGDFMMDGLLVSLLPELEEISGLELFPTYSYVRVYKKGDILAKHRDRPSCEISVTLCLGFETGEPWPIWVEGPNGVTSANLQAGDALLYRGTECMHWREAFEGHAQAQVFLHYVNRNGPHAEWKYDRRQSPAEFLPTFSNH